LADQISKRFVRQNFTASENSALPFGASLPGQMNMIVVAAALAVFIFFAWKHFPRHIGAVLIIGGALSNFFDRAIKGTVTDFINLGFSVINFADIAIYAGIAMLCCKKFIPRP